MPSDPTLEQISAAEIANYAVCPEAWRLKYLGRGQRKQSAHADEVKNLRAEWVKQQDLSAEFRYYAKIIYCLLVLIVIVLFLIDWAAHFPYDVKNRRSTKIDSAISSSETGR